MIPVVGETLAARMRWKEQADEVFKYFQGSLVREAVPERQLVARWGCRDTLQINNINLCAALYRDIDRLKDIHKGYLSKETFEDFNKSSRKVCQSTSEADEEFKGCASSSTVRETIGHF